MAGLILSALTIYPIKSAGGIDVPAWPVDELGLRYDRRWMVVNSSGAAVTQRECPPLALVRTAIEGDRLLVHAPGRRPLALPLEPDPGVVTTAHVWGDACPSHWMGEPAAQWFSGLLGIPCSLVHMPETTHRFAEAAYAPTGTRIGYADAYPFLLLSRESLADLNRRLPSPLPINRFRPNLVIEGGEPYVEDRLRRFRIGALELAAVKPCARCALTTIDQDTAARGVEPLRTLATYRRTGSEVRFGQNVVHRTTGRLTVGEPVCILTTDPVPEPSLP